ncbi:hypothetical protein AMATHDRAFT_85010 [Amanita thiersii Skay4041]|uniref:Pyridoxamine 5'-phosphate oxidase N-terminal domain-containing protein n=1 Tax=Amanita thiersii Skay4041 TaxID=703135 RepID=A0A2A9NNA9_9AGAR|nr:hypothetical protein AMATHDRAFT_85010 [Amanita thiersii Skay4041]
MGQFFDEIPEFLVSWVLQQKLFWVGTAPLGQEGHVNVSPKGGAGTFHVVDSKRVWYEDKSGSGVETIAHLRENGRITVLFNAFEGPPRIVRLFGTGTVYEFATPEYDASIPISSRKPGSRAVIMIDVHKVGTSCGYGVPFFDYRAERTRLDEMAAQKESVDNVCPTTTPHPETLTDDIDTSPNLPEDGLKLYWSQNNIKSIDGLPALLMAFKSARRFNDHPEIEALVKAKQGGGDANEVSKGKGKGLLSSPPLPSTSSVMMLMLVVLAFGTGVSAIIEKISRVCQVQEGLP